MAFLGGFDASQVEPTRAFEPVPEGKYISVITASEFKRTKNGAGQYLELKIQIVDGLHSGRQFWERLNLENANPVAVEIAKGTLSAICRAAGIMAPQDSAELHDIPIEVKIVCRKDASTGEIRNEIKGYAKAGGGGNGGGFGAGAAFTPPPVQTPPPAVQPAAVRKTAPWAKS